MNSIAPQKQMTGMLGHPVAENPIDRMFDAVYAHHGLHWQFWKNDIANERDLALAVAALRPLGAALGNRLAVMRRICSRRCAFGAAARARLSGKSAACACTHRPPCARAAPVSRAMVAASAKPSQQRSEKSMCARQ